MSENMVLRGTINRTEIMLLRGKLKLLDAIMGYSAYEVAVLNGFEGTEEEWLESLKGKDADVEVGPGLFINKNGKISVVEATRQDIDYRSERPDGAFLTPGLVDYIAKYGLAYSNLAGTSDAWTEQEKANARKLLEAIGKNGGEVDELMVKNVFRFGTGVFEDGVRMELYGQKEDAVVEMLTANDDPVRLYGIKRPVYDEEAANKEYVDDAVESALPFIAYRQHAEKPDTTHAELVEAFRAGKFICLSVRSGQQFMALERYFDNVFTFRANTEIDRVQIVVTVDSNNQWVETQTPMVDSTTLNTTLDGYASKTSMRGVQERQDYQEQQIFTLDATLNSIMANAKVSSYTQKVGFELQPGCAYIIQSGDGAGVRLVNDYIDSAITDAGGNGVDAAKVFIVLVPKEVDPEYGSPAFYPGVYQRRVLVVSVSNGTLGIPDVGSVSCFYWKTAEEEAGVKVENNVYCNHGLLKAYPSNVNAEMFIWELRF